MDSGEREAFARNKARVAELEARKARIRQLNDDLRTDKGSGRWMVTDGLMNMGELAATAIIHVACYDRFSDDNDPHDEHDFGSLEIDGHKLFWKIDYYDLSLEYGSPNPADPSVTARVLTLMLAEEY